MIRSLVTAISILLLISAFLPAAVIHVPEDQPTIQAGIEAAVDGDTVLVGPGTYSDHVDFLGKTIIVRSTAGPELTIIDGWYHIDHVVTIGEGSESGTVLEGFTVTDGFLGGIQCHNSSPTITDNIITRNGHTGGQYFYPFGGIYAYNGSPTICQNSITFNASTRPGAGILCYNGTPLIADNWIFDNQTMMEFGFAKGGGISAGSDAIITGNVIEENSADSMFDESSGGGIHGGGHIENNVIRNNRADYGDGIFICQGVVRNNLFIDDGLCCEENINFLGKGAMEIDGNIIPDILIVNEESTILSNTIVTGEITLGSDAALVLRHSNIVQGEAAITVNGGASYDWGPGMISADPLFVNGPLGDYYLSQVAAGQAMDSPCIDAGDPNTETPMGVTRTDGYPDEGITDIGYHYPALGIVVGPGPSELNPPRIRIMSLGENARPIHDSNAYGASGYGVNVACGDPDGDSELEIITGAGPGDIYGPHVRGFETNGMPLQDLSFMAYGTLKYGVNVAAGDLDGNGADEIITGAGPGTVFGPHVRAFSYTPGSGVSAVPGVNYFAYATLRWGVNVTAGDIDGDGFDEIVTGAGPGAIFGPHVRGWNIDGGTAAPIPNMGFMAYNTWKYGVNVCCADLNGDGVDEIITGPGPSNWFGAHIRGWRWDGNETTPLPNFSFFAWPPESARFGARVGKAADLDHDGADELLVCAGPDPNIGSPVTVYRYGDEQVTEWFRFEAFPAGWTHGCNASAGWLN